MPWKRCLAGDLADVTKSPKSQLLLFDSGFTEGQPGVRCLRCLWKGLSVIFVSAAGQSRERGRRRVWRRVSVPLAGWSSRKSPRGLCQDMSVCRFASNKMRGHPLPHLVLNLPWKERTFCSLKTGRSHSDPLSSQRLCSKACERLRLRRLQSLPLQWAELQLREDGFPKQVARRWLQATLAQAHIDTSQPVAQVGGGRLTAPPGTRAAKIS